MADFFQACRDGGLDTIKSLIQEQSTHPLEFNWMGEKNDTPLIVACRNGHVEVIKELFRHTNVDVNEPKRNGYSALAIARENGQIQVMKVIKEQKRKVMTVEDEIQFIKENLDPKLPYFLKAISMLQDLHSESETRELALSIHLLNDFQKIIPDIGLKHLEGFFRMIFLLSSVDQVATEMLKMNFYTPALRLFAKTTGYQSHVLVPLRLTFAKHRAICEAAVKQCPEFVDELIKLGYIDASSILLMLAEFLPDVECATIALNSLFLHLAFDSYQRGRCLGCLMYAAEIEQGRNLLAEYHADGKVWQFLTSTRSEETFAAGMILALMFLKEMGPPKKADLLPFTMPENLIVQVVDALKPYVYENVKVLIVIAGVSAACRTILMVICSLARNLDSLSILKQQKVPKFLIDLFINRKETLLEESSDTFEQAIKAVWQLGYDAECRQVFLDGGLIDLIRNYRLLLENENIRSIVDNMLGTLLALENQGIK